MQTEQGFETKTCWATLHLQGRKVAVRLTIRAIESPDEEYELTIRTEPGMGAHQVATQKVTFSADELATWLTQNGIVL